MSVNCSIIIPTYNRRDLVGRAILSARSSAGTSAEIIVVDDGSTDDTSFFIEKNFDDIILISQKNCGVSSARNAGLRSAAGDYVIFLDSDDFFEGKFVEFITQYAQAHRLDFATGLTKRYFGDGVVEISETFSLNATDTEIFTDFYFKVGAQTGSFAWRREFLIEHGGWEESLSIGDDTEFFFRMMLKGAKGAGFPFGFLVYDLGHCENRLTRRFSLSAIRSASSALLRLEELSNSSDLPRPILGRIFYEYARIAFSNECIMEGRELILAARRLGFTEHLGSNWRKMFAKYFGPEFAYRTLAALDRKRSDIRIGKTIF